MNYYDPNDSMVKNKPTTHKFIVQLASALLYDIVSVVDYTNKSSEEVKEVLMSSGKYMTAQLSGSYPNCADPHRVKTIK